MVIKLYIYGREMSGVNWPSFFGGNGDAILFVEKITQHSQWPFMGFKLIGDTFFYGSVVFSAQYNH